MNVSNNLKQTVLVTGGTGFIAQHCIIALLNASYRVRTTVRSLHREIEVRENLKVGGISPNAELSFVEADLSADAGWEKAVQGCTYYYMAHHQHLQEIKLKKKIGLNLLLMEIFGFCVPHVMLELNVLY
ncbi:MAG: hypothetical protein GAK29_01588 [Acinetobacter bereziniae]|uniref:NmrA-like domain-containing protein n=1 Tax=Acinetobacter bereziniae TaxID=106648 RepID=A0A833PH19_ACIBZ|nr:MAG: hypothetical protein GAK29_01588 [Acinetobacter bereziniae]